MKDVRFHWWDVGSRPFKSVRVFQQRLRSDRPAKDGNFHVLAPEPQLRRVNLTPSRSLRPEENLSDFQNKNTTAINTRRRATGRSEVRHGRREAQHHI